MDKSTLAPETVIADIHLLAQEMGFRRVRIDRSQYENTQWIEVGYGCGEIKVRTNVPALVYRADANRVSMDAVVELFANLLDWSPEEGPQ